MKPNDVAFLRGQLLEIANRLDSVRNDISAGTVIRADVHTLIAASDDLRSLAASHLSTKRRAANSRR